MISWNFHFSISTELCNYRYFGSTAAQNDWHTSQLMESTFRKGSTEKENAKSIKQTHLEKEIMLHRVQLEHTSLTHLKRGCQEMRCWCSSCRFCLWTPRDFFKGRGRLCRRNIVLQGDRMIILDKKIFFSKLWLWAKEFRQIMFVNKRILQGSEGLSEVFWHKDMSPLIEDSSCAACAGKVPTIRCHHSLSQSARGCQRICEIGRFHNWGKRSWHSWIQSWDIDKTNIRPSACAGLRGGWAIASMKNINDKYHQMWFWWSSLSPLPSPSLWAFCPTLSVSLSHTFLPPG